MRLLLRTLSLFCAGLLAASSHAQPGPAVAPPFTPADALRALFDVEGNTPYASPYTGTLQFSALASKFDSGHGHGYRNEMKIADRQRRSVARTHEHFAAQVTPALPDGAKTIVAQYHVDGLDTILKLYLQDTADRKGLDGKAGNGIFDILVRITGTDGKEATTALGTVRSGDSFWLDIDVANGEALVVVKTDANGSIATARTRLKGETRNIYFKFGDYLQALDAATEEHTTVAAKWDDYYRLKHIDSSRITFSHTRFVRD